LETHFACQWGKDFTRLGAITWEQLALEEDLKEDLGVKSGNGTVEGSSWNGWVNFVGGSDGVGYKERDSLNRGESRISEPRQDCGDVVSWLWNGEIGSGGDRWGAAGEVQKARCTSAVGNTDSGGEVNKVASTQAGFLEDGELASSDIVDSCVSVVRLFSRVEDQDRAVSSSSLPSMDGETDGVVEGKTKGRVSLFTTLAAIEKFGLQ